MTCAAARPSASARGHRRRRGSVLTPSGVAHLPIEPLAKVCHIGRSRLQSGCPPPASSVSRQLDYLPERHQRHFGAKCITGAAAKCRELRFDPFGADGCAPPRSQPEASRHSCCPLANIFFHSNGYGVQFMMPRHDRHYNAAPGVFVTIWASPPPTIAAILRTLRLSVRKLPSTIPVMLLTLKDSSAVHDIQGEPAIS